MRRVRGGVDPQDDARLQLALGWNFTDLELLERALTHRSYCSEHGLEESNERLEFLGDAVLGFVVTTYAYDRFPHLPEGELAKLRAAVVSAETLAVVAQELDVGACLRLGKGEDVSGGRGKPSILADAMEALIAAVYLDGGIDPARGFILSLFAPLVASAGERAAEASFTEDWKSALQEWSQAQGRGLPHYRLAAAEGPDHRRRFDIEVLLEGEIVARAEGRSKKEAEQQAAKAALSRFQ
jgi:ribonuclease-3